MIAALVGAGWRLAAEPGDADVLIVNTCGFISPAKKESIETSLELKQRHPGKKVYMVGCLSERYGADLAAELPGNRRVSRQPRSPRGSWSSLPGREPARPKARSLRPAHTTASTCSRFPGSAYLKIAEGCRNRCTYCAIPLIRGDLASRRPSEVVEEAGRLLDRGIRELVLIAQDLGSYGRDLGEPALPRLLSELARIPGDYWVRLLYIHPDHFPYDILDIMADDRRFLPYFDLPFQHAAPGILRAMGRRGDPEANLALLSRIRGRLPGAVIRSTFLLGFPGETDEDFDRLLSFQEQARPDWLGCFTYSREEDTPAWAMKGRVTRAVAAAPQGARSRPARGRSRRSSSMRMSVDTLDVLVEEQVQGEELSLGRAYLQAPDVDGLVVVRAAAQPGSRVPRADRAAQRRGPRGVAPVRPAIRDPRDAGEPAYMGALNPEQRRRWSTRARRS